MPRAPRPTNERERLAALRQCDILDTSAEAGFDDLTALAAEICDTPIALVSLIDEERQWFKSKIGLCISETHRDLAFCAHAIHLPGPMIVRDATQDVRTQDNVLVTGAPFIRFYAGVPLRNSEGFALGTLCVIDVKPRDISDEQLEALQKMARQVVAQLELRREAASNERMREAIDGTRYGIGRVVLATLVIGLAFTTFTAFQSYRTAIVLAQQRFDRLNGHVLDEIRRRVNLPAYGLRGGCGVFAASKSVERDEFSRYVASRDLSVEFPGVLGFGFIERVMRPDLERFVAAERRDDAPNFAVHAISPTAPVHDDLYIIKYIYPLERNEAAWGVDVGSEPIRREAVERAVLSGEPAITAAVKLPQVAGMHHGFLYMVPVYQSGARPPTPQERLDSLVGVMYAPILLEDALHGVFTEVDGMLDFDIFDGETPSNANQLFGTKSNAHSDHSGNEAYLGRDPTFAKMSTIAVGGRTWSVLTTSTPTFDAGVDQTVAIGAGVSGAVLSLLLSAAIWSLGRSRARAFALAHNMTADLGAAKDLAVQRSWELQNQSTALRVQSERLELALDGGGLGTWDLNPQTGAATFDARWSEILGEHDAPEHVDGWLNRIHPKDLPAVNECLRLHLAGQAPVFESTHRLRTREGSWCWTRARGVVVSRDAHGSPARVVGITQDITDEKKAEDAINASADMLRRTGQMARVGGWEVDLLTQQVTWSDEVYQIHEMEIGTPITVAQGLAFYAPAAREQVESALRAATTDGVPWDLELPLITAKGKHIWVRAHGECVRDENTIIKVCGAFQDITERKSAEELLRLSATHDKLTGLPNRALLTDRLQQCLNRYARHPERAFAVLFMDFDRFKLTNDTLGHEAGDNLLKQIAGRLRGCLRTSDSVGLREDTSIVARLGGDEFVVILDEIASPQDAVLVADRLLTALASPYVILAHSVVSTASIGVVTSNPNYQKPDEMLRDADIAMYEAKVTGKGRYVIFDKEMHQRIERRVQTETDLRTAIEQHQLFLAYQPIISLATGENQGVEALLRWNHPTRGVVGPSELIPIAEETGLIYPIEDWVLRTACEQFQTWRKTLGTMAPASISVNLSRQQLAVANLPGKVEAILRESGMAPECLHLEVTESAVMKDPLIATQLLEHLQRIGVKIDMDDFGTGHSSLAMLHQFPIDVLKIDRSFVANLSQGREFAAMVYAIVQLAHNLGMSIVAEGIETIDQLAMLQSIDCEMGQGYLISRPLTAAGFEEFQKSSRVRMYEMLAHPDRSLDARLTA